MGTLIGAYVIGMLFMLVSLAVARRVERRADDADQSVLVEMRKAAEARWLDVWLAIWALLDAVAGIFLLARGSSIGWGWLGAAVVFGLAIVVSRRSRARVLATLGDRGAVGRTDRHVAGAAKSYRWLMVAAIGYVGGKVVRFAYPGAIDGLPDGAVVAIGFFGVLLAVGIVGFGVARLRMYLRGDDLPEPDRP